jgi:hypothetical protein
MNFKDLYIAGGKAYANKNYWDYYQVPPYKPKSQSLQGNWNVDNTLLNNYAIIQVSSTDYNTLYREMLITRQ